MATALAGATRVPINLLVPSGTNPRKDFSKAEHEELVASIKTHGLLQRIVVRPGKGATEKFEIVAGERRFRACKAAGLEEVEVEIRELSDGQVLELQLVENLQRQDLSPLEEIDGICALVDAGADVEQLAERIGKSRSYVYQRTQMKKLCAKGRELLVAGEFTEGHWVEIARLPEGSQLEVIKWLGGWHGERASVRDLRDHIARAVIHDLRRAPWDLEDGQLVRRAGKCSDCEHNTGDPKPRCMLPTCWDRKMAAHRKAMEAQAQEEYGKKPIKVSGTNNYRSGTGADMVEAKGDWQRVRADRAGQHPKAVPAIIEGGHESGKLVLVEPKPGRGKREKSPAEKAEATRRKKAALEAKIQREANKVTFDQLTASPVKLSKDVLVWLVVAAGSNMWAASEWLRAQVWEDGNEKEIDAEATVKRLKALSSEELTRLLLGCVLAGELRHDQHSGPPGLAAIGLCLQLDVDPDKIFKAKERELKPQQKKVRKKK